MYILQFVGLDLSKVFLSCKGENFSRICYFLIISEYHTHEKT